MVRNQVWGWNVQTSWGPPYEAPPCLLHPLQDFQPLVYPFTGVWILTLAAKFSLAPKDFLNFFSPSPCFLVTIFGQSPQFSASATLYPPPHRSPTPRAPSVPPRREHQWLFLGDARRQAPICPLLLGLFSAWSPIC